MHCTAHCAMHSGVALLHPLLAPGGACSILPAAPMVPALISGRELPSPTCRWSFGMHGQVDACMTPGIPASWPHKRRPRPWGIASATSLAHRALRRRHRVLGLAEQHAHALLHRLRQPLARLQKDNCERL